MLKAILEVSRPSAYLLLLESPEGITRWPLVTESRLLWHKTARLLLPALLGIVLQGLHDAATRLRSCLLRLHGLPRLLLHEECTVGLPWQRHK